MKPEDYNLSSGYLYASNPWGDSFWSVPENFENLVPKFIFDGFCTLLTILAIN